MRLVIVGELFLWRAVAYCWLPLLLWFADHALSVTCTDGLGLGLALELGKCVGDAVARVAAVLFVFGSYSFFPTYSVVHANRRANKFAQPRHILPDSYTSLSP